MLLGKNKRVEESVVKKVPYVNYTPTWHPLHHAVIVRVMERAVRLAGLGIVSKEYSLSGDGADMFGVWTIEGNRPERNWAMGFRNSMKKSFAFGGCAGNRVLVCDNLCFSGDVSYHRRHTAGMNRDQMFELAKDLVEYIIRRSISFDLWFEGLFRVSIEDHYDKVVLNAIRRGLIPTTKLGVFEKAFEEELEVNSSAGTLADFHGGITRMLREASLFSVMDKSRALNDYCDDVIDMVSDGDRYAAQYLRSRGN